METSWNRMIFSLLPTSQCHGSLVAAACGVRPQTWWGAEHLTKSTWKSWGLDGTMTQWDVRWKTPGMETIHLGDLYLDVLGHLLLLWQIAVKEHVQQGNQYIYIYIYKYCFFSFSADMLVNRRVHNTNDDHDLWRPVSSYEWIDNVTSYTCLILTEGFDIDIESIFEWSCFMTCNT